MAILRTLELNAKGVSDLELAGSFYLFRDNNLMIQVRIKDYKKCLDENKIGENNTIIVEVENSNAKNLIKKSFSIPFKNLKIIETDAENTLQFSFEFSDEYSVDTNMVEVQFRLSDNSSNESLTLGIISLEVRPGIYENNTERYYRLNDVETFRNDLQKKIDANTETIKNNKSDIEDKLNTAKTQLSSTISSNKSDIEERLNTVKTQLSSTISSNKDNIEEKLNTAKTQLSSTISSNKSDIEGKLNTAKTQLSSTISSNKSDIEGKLKLVNDELNESISENIKLMESMQDILNDEIHSTNIRVDELNLTINNEITNTVANIESRIEITKDELNNAISSAVIGIDGKIMTAKEELSDRIIKNRNELEDMIDYSEKNTERKIINSQEVVSKQISDEIKSLQDSIRNNSELSDDITERITQLESRINEDINKNLENIKELVTLTEIHGKDIDEIKTTINSYGSYKFIKLRVNNKGNLEIESASDTRCKLVAQSIKDVKLQFPEKIESAVMTNISVYSRIFPTIKYIDKDSIIFRFYNSKEEIRTVLRPSADENGKVLVNELGIPLGYTEEEITIGVGTMELEYLPVGMTVHIIYLS